MYEEATKGKGKHPSPHLFWLKQKGHEVQQCVFK